MKRSRARAPCRQFHSGLDVVGPGREGGTAMLLLVGRVPQFAAHRAEFGKHRRRRGLRTADGRNAATRAGSTSRPATRPEGLDVWPRRCGARARSVGSPHQHRDRHGSGAVGALVPEDSPTTRCVNTVMPAVSRPWDSARLPTRVPEAAGGPAPMRVSVNCSGGSRRTPVRVSAGYSSRPDRGDARDSDRVCAPCVARSPVCGANHRAGVTSDGLTRPTHRGVSKWRQTRVWIPAMTGRR